MSRVSDSLYGASIASLTLTYTTDNPSITADSAIVIADGDAATVTRAEHNNLAEELVAKVNVILTALRQAGVITGGTV